jgi:hypothetical protein
MAGDWFEYTLIKRIALISSNGSGLARRACPSIMRTCWYTWRCMLAGGQSSLP